MVEKQRSVGMMHLYIDVAESLINALTKENRRLREADGLLRTIGYALPECYEREFRALGIQPTLEELGRMIKASHVKNVVLRVYKAMGCGCVSTSRCGCAHQYAYSSLKQSLSIEKESR